MFQLDFVAQCHVSLAHTPREIAITQYWAFLRAKNARLAPSRAGTLSRNATNVLLALCQTTTKRSVSVSMNISINSWNYCLHGQLLHSVRTRALYKFKPIGAQFSYLTDFLMLFAPKLPSNVVGFSCSPLAKHVYICRQVNIYFFTCRQKKKQNSIILSCIAS